MKNKAFQLLGTFLMWAMVIGFALAWGYSAALADDETTLTGLSISGASSLNENTSQSYAAVAQFSDGTSQTVTSSATWSENSSYATISGGILTAGSVGGNQTVTITAQYSAGGVTRTASMPVTIVNVTLSALTVTGANSVNENTTSAYAATATFSDGSTRNVTASATWSDNSSFVTISGGVLTAGSVSSNRTVTITARYATGGVARTATKSVTIVNAPTVTLSSVAVTGASSVNEGTASNYTATATFSNGTTQNVTSSATWSDNSSAATVTGGVLTAGQVTANQSVIVTASYTSGSVTQSGNLTVTIVNVPATVTLSSVAVTGAGSVNEGTTSNYTATATFSNGTTQNVTSSATWSDNSSAATVTGGVLTAGQVTANQSVIVTASYTSGSVTQSGNLTVTIVNVPATVTLSSVAVTGAGSVNEGTTSNYTATATFSNGTTQNVTSSATWSDNSSAATVTGGVLTAGQVTANQSVIVTASYTSGSVTQSGNLTVTIVDVPVINTSKSINSTSQNRATLPTAPVPEQTFVTQTGFQIFSVNDLGMHCGDLDHRVASILPPFNVLHALVIQKGTSAVVPEKLTIANVDVRYSAASNPNDPALASPASAPIYKTNFWDPNPAQVGTNIAFDGYNAFYPPGVLPSFPLNADMSLPVPDDAQLYPVSGAGILTASQQDMPGISAPYAANTPQSFNRFDTDFPFFVNFPFGYRLSAMNWFAADGIAVAPFDDFGRKNSYPLMRVQAVTKDATLTGKTGDVLASVDSVVPVSAEAICYTCHTSAVDGGGGFAACIPGFDTNCANQGSPRSGKAFIVARASDDTSNLPADAKREWAADTNILRLHDVKNATTLEASKPVVCQTCHYTPALDLAHLGPLGPGDAAANGRDEKVHHSNSRVMHSYHGQFTDLFPNDMPAPTTAPNTPRTDSTGKLVVNTFVQNKLNQTCYQCHPGSVTKCLRGAMFNAGLICNDCHGNMQQVGNDFSGNFSAATPAAYDLTKRIPWANEPRCQSCHTGDAVSNLAADPNVIRASDGIRLLRAYRSNDANAKAIIATNKRFAEEDSTNGNEILYRLSKGHSGVFCEACHGSTHAEWPVQPESGTSVANDNMAAIQLQGHTGKIIECTACHTAGSLPVSLGGPHGMHPVGDSRFISSHSNIVSSQRANCRACHGQTGQGTVLSKVAVNRTVGSRTFTKGELITCSRCHSNQL